MMEKEKSAPMFSKASIFISVLRFSESFASFAFLSVLPFYLVDVLSYSESQATIFFHLYDMLCFAFNVLGGIIADSLFGHFKSIVIFSAIFSGALLLYSLTPVPPLHLPLRELSIIGTVLVAFGRGTLRPCIIAFGADQFTLPQQAKQLSLFFVLFGIAGNVGNMAEFAVTPVLRKDVTCFGQLHCYPLALVVPAILMTVSTVIIFLTKNSYTLKKPKSNIMVDVTKCAFHALYQKIRSEEKRPHWLDYADNKFDATLIEDTKSAIQLMKILSPLVIFWSIFTAQGSLLVFQALRMNGDVGGYVLKPDQIRLITAMLLNILLPLFHSYVYPFLGKYMFLGTYLRKITFGCAIAAVAYFISGVVELNLEPTYAKVPVKGFAQLRIYNTLDCDLPMTVDERNFVLGKLDFWENVDIATDGERILKYQVDFSNCDIDHSIFNRTSGNFEVTENQATSWAVTALGVNYKFIDNVSKSNSGNPLVRTLISVDGNFTGSNNYLNIVYNGESLAKIRIPDRFMETDYKEIDHKIYDLYLNDRSVEENVPFISGGVYTILGRISDTSTVVHTVAVTEPNSMSIFWAFPAFVLLVVSEIMVFILILEFIHSEAPSTMKALMQSYWIFLGFFGSLIIIIITEAQFFERKVFELFLYAALMAIGTLIFIVLSSFYKYRYVVDEETLIKSN